MSAAHVSAGARDGDGDVLEQGGGAGRARAGDRGVEALADVPERGRGRRRRVVSAGGGAQRQVGDGSPAPPRSVAARSSASAAWYSTSSAAWSTIVDVARTAGGRRIGLRRRAGTRRPSVRRRRRRSPTSAGSDAGRRVEGREDEQAGGGRADAIGTVRKVASATKPSVPSLPTMRWARICAGRVEVEEGVQAVAHGVLHRELALDRRRPSRIRRGRGRAAASAPRAARARGRAAARRRRRRRCRRRCRSAARASSTPACGSVFSSVPQAMPLELLATTPPIVHAISLAGSGPSLRP